MKKNFLFGVMAIALAVFGFGGVSLAEGNVAEIVGGQQYTTLQAAVNATQSGDVVKLLSDITNEHVSISGKNLTLDLDGHMINPSTAGTIIDIKGGSIVTIMGTGTIKNNISGDHLTLAAHGTGTIVTILNGNYYSVSTGNTALIFVYDLATITIKGGNYTGTKAGSGGKDGKVFYAGASNNESGYQNRYGTLIIEGGSFDGRISNSNWGHYVVRGGTFTKNEVVYYNNSVVPCENTYTTISFAEAGFLDEGYVITQNGGQWIVSYDPVATIGENGYSTVTGAITAAQDNDIVEILKAGTYALPATISHKITIEGAVADVKFAHSVTNTTDQIISTINEDVIFSGITFVFNGSAAQHHFAQADGKKIIMNNCIIDGIFHVRGAVDFIGCTFKREEATPLATNLYNLHLNYGNVNFDSCTFTNNNSKNINIAYGGDATYNIDFKNTQFSYTVGDPNKPAVLIHEVYKKIDYGYPNLGSVDIYTTGGIDYVKGKWNITFDSATKVNSTYGSTFVGGSQLFGLEDVYSENGVPAQGSSTEELYGSTNGGEVVVSINGTTVYSTPKHGQTWTVTFDGTGAVEVADGAKVAKPADPTRSCYRFNGWYNGNTAYNFDAVVTSGLTLTSSWTYICGGGSSSSSSNNTSNKTGSNNTGNNNTGTNNTGVNNTGTVNTGTVDTGTNNNEETVTPTDPQAVQENGYTKEFNDAYEFAFANGITTMKNIEEAAMEDGLTRIAMAKMLSQYAINVLKKTPDTSKECKFNDVSEELDAQYDHGVTLACQLGIMGVGITDFRPNDPVVRAEFGTALSRLLFGIEDGEDAYYTTHLAKLKDAGIISNDDPSLEELRGYVMLMLMRSAK